MYYPRSRGRHKSIKGGMNMLDIGQAAMALKFGFDLLGSKRKSENINAQSEMAAYKTVTNYGQAKLEQYQNLGSIIEDYVNQKDYNAWLTGYKGDSMSDDAAMVSEMNLDKDMTKTVLSVMNNIRRYNEARDIDLKTLEMNRANAQLENTFALGGSILDFAAGWLDEK